MSGYRVCKIETENHKSVNFMKFDDKEDAEHYAKNQSVADDKNIYEVQKNHSGEFLQIKSYLKGEEI